jgi:hypothetical protein
MRVTRPSASVAVLCEQKVLIDSDLAALYARTHDATRSVQRPIRLIALQDKAKASGLAGADGTQ